MCLSRPRSPQSGPDPSRAAQHTVDSGQSGWTQASRGGHGSVGVDTGQSGWTQVRVRMDRGQSGSWREWTLVRSDTVGSVHRSDSGRGSSIRMDSHINKNHSKNKNK